MPRYSSWLCAHGVTAPAKRGCVTEHVRAVGAANGRNPISIIAPCHRVIGSNGKLTGFAGGLEAKAHLLALEKEWHVRSPNPFTPYSAR